jgi:hypothetical protein
LDRREASQSGKWRWPRFGGLRLGLPEKEVLKLLGSNVAVTGSTLRSSAARKFNAAR